MKGGNQILASVWVRLIVFLWMIIFPIVFVAVPALEMFQGEAATTLSPLWALVLWLLGPLAVSITIKYAGAGSSLSAKNTNLMSGPGQKEEQKNA